MENRIVFKDWLEERGVLKDWIRARLEDGALDLDDDGGVVSSNPVDRDWILNAFTWSRTPRGDDGWHELHKKWRLALSDYHDVVEPGMPINDKLGLSLLLAELEDEDGT